MRLGFAFVALALQGICALAADIAQTVSPACEAVTTTVTVFANEGSSAAVPAITTAISSYSTVTSFSTLTSYVTVPSSITSSSIESVAVLASSSAYYYVDNNGTTSWLNGASPASTYSSYVTKTIQITVAPTTDAISEVTVVQTKTLTVTPAATTLEEPPSTSTVTSYLTSSLTSTHTIFLTLGSSSSVTQASPAFSVPSMTGWNTSSSALESALSGAVSGSPFSSGSLRNASACSVTLVHLTTNITYTVEYASTSSGVATNLSSSLAAAVTGAVPLTNGTGYGLSGSGSFLTTNLTSPSSASSAIAGAVSQTVATATALSSITSSVTSLPVAGYNASTVAALSSRGASTISASMGLTQYPSSTLSKAFTNTTSSTTAAPSVCGEHGDFTLTWDDEPNFVPTNPITDPSDAPPVFNPYHHFYFSSGYIYMPPPSSPYLPVSSPRLVMFLTNQTGDTSSTNVGSELSGEIGAGVHRTSSAFWFNAYSANLGCDNSGPDNCTMHITGLVYQQGTQSEVAAFQQDLTLPPCSGLKSCKLQKFDFAKSMKGLSGIRIEAFVGDQRRPWYMDDLSLGWYNNSCEAGLLRLRSK